MPKHTGDFFRQLATVVIGIVITFGGSALMQKCSERKEAAHILAMVRDELKENINLIGMNRGVLTRDSVATTALQSFIHESKHLPVDSLVKYMGQGLMSVERYDFLTTSLEVLKSSSQIQAIRNKELLRDLFLAYADLNDLQLSIQSYYSIKEQCVGEFFSNMDGYSFTDEEAIYTMFADMMKNKLIRNYVTIIASNYIMSILPAADRVEMKLQNVIGILDKEIAR